MTDVYFPATPYERFIYIGHPRTSGGQALCCDLRNERFSFEVMSQEELPRVEEIIRRGDAKPETFSNELMDQITFEIEKLNLGERTSPALDKKIKLLFRSTKNTN